MLKPKPISESKMFLEWYEAGVNGYFMGRPIKDMTREELIAIVGRWLLGEKRGRERRATRLRL